MIPRIQAAFAALEKALSAFTAQPENLEIMAKIAHSICACIQKGGMIITFGNGGSMCDAMHFAEELTGRYQKERPPLPALALSDPSYLTCVANDYGFEEVFARGVAAFGHEKNLVIGLSTSGNSENVYRALKVAKERKMLTVALLGGDGGKIKGICDFELIVPATGSARIQEIHTAILHNLVELTENQLFPETRASNKDTRNQ